MNTKDTASWVRLAGWRTAHIVAGPEETFLGVMYTRTLCGRKVRVDDVSAESKQSRCSLCAQRAGRKG